MLLGDFEINGFVGSKNKMMLMHRIDTKIPERNLTFNDSIPNIDRSVVFDDRNYKNRTFEMSFLIQASSYDERVEIYTEFIAKLDTGGYVPAVFYSDENYEYRIIRTGEITTKKTAFFEEFEELTIRVSAEPFKYLRGIETIDTEASGTKLINPTSFTSKPYIKIIGSGDITLTVNNETFTFKGVTGSIELDSSLQSVWRMNGNTAVNENKKMVIGPFPVLKPGKNKISLSAGTATVQPRWRTL